MFIRKSKVEAVLAEMRIRAVDTAYVSKAARGGYLFAIVDFEQRLRVRARRPGIKQVQKGGHGSVQIQSGGNVRYDPALDWPDRYPDGGQ